jgi:hypothetical protein
VLVTVPALVIGAALDVYVLLAWGVLTLYLGISWVVPGACVGAAAAAWGKERGNKRPNALGFTVGPIVAVGLLVLMTTILVAFQGDRLSQERAPEPEANPVLSDLSERVSLVTRTAGRNRLYGPVAEVRCDQDSVLPWCVVTYQAPACQLWELVNIDGVDTARALEDVVPGARGTLDDGPERYWIGCS